MISPQSMKENKPLTLVLRKKRKIRSKVNFANSKTKLGACQ